MTGRCSLCQKPVTDAFHPFCSKRCKMVDLNRWLSGTYAVADTMAIPDDET